jgi:microcystin-dependent protein
MSNYYGSNGYPIPTGAILPFIALSQTQIPAGYLPCTGGQYNPVLYPELFAVIGTTFNTGGETAGFFRVPDLVNNPYTKPGAFNPVPTGDTVLTQNISLVTPDLPTLGAGDFTASVAFTNPISTPSLYEHDNGGNTGADSGSGTEFVKADSHNFAVFGIEITGGSASYTPGSVTPVPAEITLGQIRPAGYLLIHIIKAVQVGIAPQILAPAVVPQFPAPQYLYTNMAWLNGFTDFNF